MARHQKFSGAGGRPPRGCIPLRSDLSAALETVPWALGPIATGLSEDADAVKLENPRGQEGAPRPAEAPDVERVRRPADQRGGAIVNLCLGTRTTIVVITLSASVCRLASHSGKSHPM